MVEKGKEVALDYCRIVASRTHTAASVVALSGIFFGGCFLGGCFFDEVVNEAPVAGIRPLGDGTHYVRDTLSFDARKSTDEVGSTLTCEWQARTCSDSNVPRCEAIGTTVIGTINTVFEVEVASHDSIEIQLRVTDEYGASRLQPDLLTVDIQNLDPQVALQDNGDKEAGAYILYRPIQLVVVNPTGGESLDPDGDPVELTWRLLPPAMSKESARSFEAVGDEGYILTPDVSGTWTVELTVTDDFGGSARLERDLFVGPDAAPCLRSLDPVAHEEGFYLVDSADGPRSFSVLSVHDVLDPFPGPVNPSDAQGESTFTWFLREPGSADFVPIPDFGGASYAVDPLAYQPGDELEVRVESHDRVSGPERALGCAESTRRCELVAGSECYQRQTWGLQIQ